MILWTRQRAGYYTAGDYTVRCVGRRGSPNSWVLEYRGAQESGHYSAQEAKSAAAQRAHEREADARREK